MADIHQAIGEGAREVEPLSAATVRTSARQRWWADVRRRRMLALADLASALLAGLVASQSLPDAAWAALFAPLWLVLAKLIGLYDRDHRAIRHLTIDEIPSLLAWSTGGILILVLLLPLTPADTPTAAEAILGALAGAVSALFLRGAARYVWRRITPAERTLVVGDGEAAAAIHRRAALFADMHMELMAPEPLPIGTLGDIPESGGLTRGVDRIIVASSQVDPDQVAQLSEACRRDQVKLSVISPLRGRALPVLRLSKVAELPIFEFNTSDPSRSTMAIKHGFDLVVATLGLLITAPLLPLIAIAIRLDSRGPVIFGQLRAGVEGEPFRLYKFRTMRADAEDQLRTVVDLDQLEEPMFKLNADPRITRVGRVLRRLSLDEIPQFVNVLRGQMSIVGPRPEQMELVQRYRPEHRFRLAVKPGVTGPMQVYGRGELTFAERLAVELDYVENLSLAQDLRILALTVPVVLRGRGAY
jgi:exopolysaccharide biosynthesis polyprenyl glycosylphosphotransferase